MGGETGDRLDPIPVFVPVTGQIPGLKTLCHNRANRRGSIKEDSSKLTFMRWVKHLVVPVPQAAYWACHTPCSLVQPQICFCCVCFMDECLIMWAAKLPVHRWAKNESQDSSIWLPADSRTSGLGLWHYEAVTETRILRLERFLLRMKRHYACQANKSINWNKCLTLQQHVVKDGMKDSPDTEDE